LEFPHDAIFFENGADPRYRDIIAARLQPDIKALLEAKRLYKQGGAVKLKAGIVATMRNIHTLAVDLPRMRSFSSACSTF
jgi:virulence-associated protein VapD